ncbi:MAG: type II secretion system protein [Candidatus Saccharibacteria bacterium]|nr:type II secretion system protein [Candidatus Saccharibacteria bacterium]
MNAPQLKNKNGFTIIEVVLVLAIAALIFLMVFIALPALQRNQRDTQRRQDVSRVTSQIEQYRTNNRGKIPAEAATGAKTLPAAFLSSYLNGEFKDPGTDDDYNAVTSFSSLATGKAGDYVYLAGAKCNDESSPTAGGARNYALAMKLEGSGVFCQGN